MYSRSESSKVLLIHVVLVAAGQTRPSVQRRYGKEDDDGGVHGIEDQPKHAATFLNHARGPCLLTKSPLKIGSSRKELAAGQPQFSL